MRGTVRSRGIGTVGTRALFGTACIGVIKKITIIARRAHVISMIRAPGDLSIPHPKVTRPILYFTGNDALSVSGANEFTVFAYNERDTAIIRIA